MAFSTLAERFEQRSREIYTRFPPSDTQPVVIKPDTDGVFGSRSRIKDDTRAVPTVSIRRDVRRVSQFLSSSEGMLFLSKQALLQTGNTFVNTKLYNPLSPLANTVPFLHTLRHISSQTLTGNPSGLLQRTTVDALASSFNITNTLSAVQSSRRGVLSRISSAATTFAKAQLKNISNKILPVPQSYVGSRPEYKVFGLKNQDYIENGPILFPRQPLAERGSKKLDIKASFINTVVSSARQRATAFTIQTINRQIPKSIRNKVSIPTPSNTSENTVPLENSVSPFLKAAAEFKDNFNTKNKGDVFARLNTVDRFKSSYLTEKYAGGKTSQGNQFENIDKNQLKTGIQDEYNFYPDYLINSAPSAVSSQPTTETNTQESQKTDIIKFVFSSLNGTNIRFRALISSIKESIKPEFNEQRYVGRTERFVTYGGAKRSVSLAFNIVAFSKDEIEGMWGKINYLTGLTFPDSVRNGFMVPPLFKVSIGGIYENQPCYIESLDYDFLDETITFDIDKEVPFAINVTMQLSLLEKRSKFYNSPFYKITEIVEQRRLDVIDVSANRALSSANPQLSLGENNPRRVWETNRRDSRNRLLNIGSSFSATQTDSQNSNFNLQEICGENADCYENPTPYLFRR